MNQPVDPRVLKIDQLADLNANYPDRSVMPQHHRQALEALEAEVKSFGDADQIKADEEKTKDESRVRRVSGLQGR